jgi:4-hydroxybenzoate polyprenyltransferase
MNQIRHYASLVKISHSIFALPFAAAGYAAALREQDISVEPRVLLCVALCMFFARNAAMSFNRYADKKYDALNPRTAQREIPKGIITPQNALLFCIVNAVCFAAAAFAINALCFALSPVALLIILGYSYTKRFTALCHLVLGLGLAAAPTGAYLAAAGHLSATPLMLSALVVLWVTGFDIIYAMPDHDFDRHHKLHSIPAAVGLRNALNLAAALHIACSLMVGFIGIYLGAGVCYYVGGALFIACMAYQRSIVAPDKLHRINPTFGVVNGMASIVYCVCFIAFCLST